MTTWTATLLVVHLAGSASMLGLIWFVQLVHYPLFDSVSPDRFVAYESAHQRRTAWVVGPLMGIEGVTALIIAAVLRDDVGVPLVLLGLALLAVIHASTVFVQVPAHTKLSNGFDAEVHERLVRGNWVRTIGWSLRTVVAGAMLVVAAT